MKCPLSTVVPIEPSMGAKKLGQPVPLSNFRSLTNSGCAQPAHVNVPSRFSCNSAQDPGRSVPCCRNTVNCSGVSCARHSSSVFVMLNVLVISSSPRLFGNLQHVGGGKDHGDDASTLRSSHHAEHAHAPRIHLPDGQKPDDLSVGEKRRRARACLAVQHKNVRGFSMTAPTL